MRRSAFVLILASLSFWIQSPPALAGDVCIQHPGGTICEDVPGVAAFIRITANNTELTFLELNGETVLDKTGYGLSTGLLSALIQIFVDGETTVKVTESGLRVQICLESTCTAFMGVLASGDHVYIYGPTGCIGRFNFGVFPPTGQPC